MSLDTDRSYAAAPPRQVSSTFGPKNLNESRIQLIVDVLKEALAEDESFFELYLPADDAPGVEISGGPGLFEEACVFDDASDETVAEIL